MKACSHSWEIIKEKTVNIDASIIDSTNFSTFGRDRHEPPVEKKAQEEKRKGEKYLLVLVCKHCGLIDKTFV